MPFGNPDFTPAPVRWGGQTFSDPQALAQWLRARGASPAIWAIRHPGAAAGLGMPTPTSVPATPPAQQTGGGFQGLIPNVPPSHPQGPMPQMPPSHPQGPLGAPWMPEGPGGLEGFLGQKSPWGPPQLDIELIRLKHALAQVGAAGGKARRGTGRKRAIPASKDRQPSPHPKGDMVLHYDPKHNRERRRARRALRGKYF